MQIRFLLGPAGSGKTFHCLQEIRSELAANPEGPPLLLLAPKQATFQLERQLLEDASLGGYTRLQILSFDRFAQFFLEEYCRAWMPVLDEEGRLMVLRALLRQHQNELATFRAAARLPGFAQQLSGVLRELHQSKITTAQLHQAAQRSRISKELADKLHDLALVQRAYHRWLEQHHLQDADTILDRAADQVRVGAAAAPENAPSPIAGLWLDGFAQFTPQELALLTAILHWCRRATLAFCLDKIPAADLSWISPWSAIAQTFRQTYHAAGTVPGATLEIEVLPRRPGEGRFASAPCLEHLEKQWSEARPSSRTIGTASAEEIRIVRCPNPHAEAVTAARQILQFVQSGGRFRDVTVMVRQLPSYSGVLRRVFRQYEIPFFLDQRESIAHHPVAELTRSALRTITFNWRLEDWFGALKTNLVPANEWEIDWLENEALAGGWEGDIWHRPFVQSEKDSNRLAEAIRARIVPSFLQLRDDLGGAPPFCVSGPPLALALQSFWSRLEVRQRLESWSGQNRGIDNDLAAAVHTTAWEQLQRWTENISRGFSEDRLALTEWLPILESGLSSLTVGAIPPALDQVLIGAVDRTRNPEIQCAIILGFNSSVFPATPAPPQILTEADRRELESEQLPLQDPLRQGLGLEEYLAYIALTRARRQLILTFASANANDQVLHPSPFLGQVQRIFPSLQIDPYSALDRWSRCVHSSELLPALFSSIQCEDPSPLAQLQSQFGADICRDVLRWRPGVAQFSSYVADECLSPETAAQLFGPEPRLSMTRLENFGACPFKFFVHTGLGAQERKRLQFDATWLGSFQHEILRKFHDQIVVENKKWRDLSAAEGSDRINRLVEDYLAACQASFPISQRDLWAVRRLSASLCQFIQVVLGWMAQYQFDPAAVELKFGENAPLPPFEVPLSSGRKLVFSGGIDRVDLCRVDGAASARCVVVDYKSSNKKIDAQLLAHGAQLQLPAYLTVLQRSAAARDYFGVKELVPAGVFYVNLRGQFAAGANRNEVLQEKEANLKRAYRHLGRFNSEFLRKLDSRPDALRGDQFNYAINKSGELSSQTPDPLAPGEFQDLLDQIERQIVAMGEAILSGDARVAPYRRGTETPCDVCEYQSICRIDPWTHSFRTLASVAKSEAPCL